MYVIRDINTNRVIASFAYRHDAEAFLAVGDNINRFTLEA